MKRMCLILACLLLLCSLLAACTPDSGKETKPTVPQPGVPTVPSVPEEQTAPVGTVQTEPAGQNTAATQPVDPATEPPATEPLVTGLSAAEATETAPPFGGLDIEDEYSETIGDNVGIGGAG